LGNINKIDVEKIGKVIFESTKEYSPLKLAAKGVGVFPGIKRPRIIWIGITGQIDLLMEMQKTLDKRLETIGFPKERRPFRGHLTIGRIKGKVDPQRLIAAIKEFGEFESETFIANKLILFKSELNPSGSIYTKLKSISLVLK
jgi:2'-5' RNA ligase